MFPSITIWKNRVVATGDEKFAEPKFYQYYNVKFQIANFTKPKRIAEIGVRYGYSAYAFLSAVPDASYTGYDLLGGGHGGVAVDTFGHVRKILGRDFPNAQVALIHADSQKLESLDGCFDFVHVDGNHSAAGCLHDCRLAIEALAPGGYILVDDYVYISGVNDAVHKFIDEQNGSIERSFPYPSLRGEYVIQKKGVADDNLPAGN
jgi:predicted O-methyltransferase YrrM